MARPQPTARPDLAAKLTMGDLARVRQALAILSDDRAAEAPSAAGEPGGPVPSVVAVGPYVAPGASDGDDADTFPLPVILPGVTTIPQPEALEAVRGPFEPARPSPAVAEPSARAQHQPASAPGELAPASPAAGDPAPANALVGEPAPGTAAPDESAALGKGREMPPAAEEKLDQIKDLLLMAEAIGEQNLDRHFDQVSQRQRELIREFFDRAAPGDQGA